MTIDDLRGMEFVASPLGDTSQRLLDEACSEVDARRRIVMAG